MRPAFNDYGSVPCTCEHCGALFRRIPSQAGRYCSNRCSAQARAAAARAQRSPRVCATCGRAFEDLPSVQRQFCSRACRYSASIADRFWPRVQKSDGCWLWTGGNTAVGYGKMWVKGRQQMAHRVGYELQVGPIPDGKLVLHRCDTPACVRGEHLFIGTPLENARDMLAKGRAYWQKAGLSV